MRQWKTVIQILRCSWRPLFEFELLYKLLAVTVFTPLASLSFRGIMEATGYSYLTADNIGLFLKSPMALLLLAVLLLLLSFYVVFDISAILYALDQGQRGCRAEVPAMIAAAGRASVRIFRPRNWPLAAAALVLLPFLNIGIVSGFVSTVAIPEAIIDYILRHWYLPVLAAALFALLVVLLLRWLYVFHYYGLEGLRFGDARRHSVRLGRRRHLRDFLSLVLLQIGISLAFILLVLLLVAAIVWLTKLLASAAVVKSVLTSAVWVALGVMFLIFTVLSVPLGFCCISALYYTRKAELGEPCAAVPDQLRRRPGKTGFQRVEAVVLALSLICCSVYVYRVSKGESNFNIEYIRTMEVTAHRGASAAYPENTMRAFQAAVELGADWIELDVQQTRDGEIIVMHDTNLRRTAGINQNIWETDWEELAALEAGSWFSESFSGEPIPRLEEVLEFAEETGVRLNIELKPSGHETAFEQGVVDRIRSYGLEDRCVVTSQNYEVLKQIKAYAPEIKTVYVMRVAYGDLLKLEAADAFSVKAVNITSSMVSRLHDGGRELYAWTVNTPNSIDKMIRLNVDNIITDNVTLARSRIYSSKTSNIIQEYISFLGSFG